MDWSQALPILNGTIGGVAMAVFIYGIVTNKIALPREVIVWKELYNEEKAARQKLEGTVESLTVNLSKQNTGHLDTIEILKTFIPRERQPTGD